MPSVITWVSFMLSVKNKSIMLIVVMLNVIMLSVIMLNVVLMSIVMLNDVMLIVVAPLSSHCLKSFLLLCVSKN
jgi:hypothetical protein